MDNPNECAYCGSLGSRVWRCGVGRGQRCLEFNRPAILHLQKRHFSCPAREVGVLYNIQSQEFGRTGDRNGNAVLVRRLITVNGNMNRSKGEAMVKLGDGT
jgi:hypothetical protein